MHTSKLTSRTKLQSNFSKCQVQGGSKIVNVASVRTTIRSRPRTIPDPGVPVDIIPSHAATDHSGNGRRGEIRNAEIKSRTECLLRNNSSTSLSSSFHAAPYHSGGIWLATSHTLWLSNSSIRVAHGSKESHPV